MERVGAAHHPDRWRGKTTITPRKLPQFARLGAAAAVGATSITLDAAPAVGTILTGSSVLMEQVAVSAVSGTGPYTATIGALVNAHDAGEPVSWSDEMNPRLINNYLRNIPDGITGVFDFERLLEAAPDSNAPDPRYASGDILHFLRGSSVEKARCVVAAGVQPRFGA